MRAGNGPTSRTPARPRSGARPFSIAAGRKAGARTSTPIAATAHWPSSGCSTATGSRIVSEFGDGSGRWDERHTVVTADRRKFVFVNRGGVQTVYDEDGRPISVSEWTDNGPESLPNAQFAFAPAVPAAAATIEALAATTAGRIATQKAIEATLLLFTWLSRWNRPDGIAVMSFPAYVFERGKARSDAGI
jgi:hypothetical protein